MTASLPSFLIEQANVRVGRERSGDFNGKRCQHCGGPAIGMASVILPSGERVVVCHPTYGMDCYQLVTVYGHGAPCDCRGPSEHPDHDRCYRCQYRRFEHLVDAALPQRYDFLGNPVPCWEFFETPAANVWPSS
jgi:hypothetical protein